MKKVILLSVSILLICLAYSFAEVPCKINYQGRLIKDNVPVDGQVDMEFSLYTQPIGGTLKKTISINNVPVYNGLFRAVLDLEDIDWTAGETMYLEVKVGTDILTPREAIYAYPYAINSHLLEGKTTDYFLNTSVETQTKQGDLNIIGKVGIGTTGPEAKLHIDGGSLRFTHGSFGDVDSDNGNLVISSSHHNGTSIAAGWYKPSFPIDMNPLVFGSWNDDTESFQENVTFTSSGNVGIGTTSPQAKLHVGGTPGTDGIMFPDGSLQTTAGGGQSVQVVGTTNVSINSLSWVDMPDMSITMTTTGRPVLVMFSAPIIGQSSALDGYARLLIDGQEIRKIAFNNVSYEGHHVYKFYDIHWLETNLPPGQHTFKIQWKEGGVHAPANALRQYGATYRRVLTALEL